MARSPIVIFFLIPATLVISLDFPVLWVSISWKFPRLKDSLLNEQQMSIKSRFRGPVSQRIWIPRSKSASGYGLLGPNPLGGGRVQICEGGSISAGVQIRCDTGISRNVPRLKILY